MTSDPNLTPTSPATPAAPAGDDKPSLDLSIPKVAGGALAAVTTAVAASFFGVNGTLTGAAFGSVVSSIAAAVYAASLQTAHSKIKTTRSVVLRTATDDGVAAAAIDPNDPTTVPPGLTRHTLPLPGQADVRAAGPNTVPGRMPLSAPAPAASRLRLSWKPIAALAGLIFVAAMTVIFGTELAIGHPISNSQGSGTTFGDIVRGDTEPEHTRPAPSPSVSPSDTASVSTVTTSTETSGTDSPSTSEDASPTPSGPESGAPDQTSPAAPTGDGQPADSGQPSGGAASGAPASGGAPTP